jgi:AraC-like DNA-binding protein
MASSGVPPNQLQTTHRVKTRLLQQLKAVPLSAWPQALVDSLETLATLGVCSRATVAAKLRSLLVDNGRGRRADRRAPVAPEFMPEQQVVREDTEWQGSLDEAPAGRVSRTPDARGDSFLSPEIRQIRQLIQAHYREPISLRTLANGVGRNTQYLSTLFHRQTGSTVHGYLTSVRMKHAANLLRRSEKVEAVMLLVGYRGKKNFYRQFSNTFGMTPGTYKARHASGRTSSRGLGKASSLSAAGLQQRDKTDAS